MAYFQSNVDKTEDDITNSEEYRLYVTNLPVELDEDGIKQIFDHYGEVNSIFCLPNVSWAYITYKTFCEAERAIRNLHDIPPLSLKVKLSNKMKSVDQNEKITYNPKSSETCTNSVLDHQPREVVNKETMELPNYSNILHKYNQLSIISNDKHDTAYGLLYQPVHMDNYLFDPYESTKCLDYKNTLWTRGKVTVTRDGKRHVSLGRGYSLYETSEPHSLNKSRTIQNSENLSNNSYEYGQDNLKEKLEICVCCNKITAVKCGKCCSFYCSKECQMVDWPNHKIKCQQIPVLTEDNKSLSTSSNENQMEITSLHQAQKKLRRPKVQSSSNPNLQSINNKCMEDKKPESLKILNDNNSQINVTHKNDNIKNKEHKLDVTEKEIQNKYTNQNDIKMKKKEQKNDFKMKSQEQQKAYFKNTFLSTSKTTHVIILEFTQGKDFWVRKLDQESIYQKMVIDIQNIIQKSPKINPVIGIMCGYKYNNMWHRAKIMSLNPTTVFLIDLGITETAKVNEFRDISEFKTMIPFAGKLCLHKHASVKNGSLKKYQIIAVKVISWNENVIFVDVINENNNKSSTKSSKPETQLKFTNVTSSTNNNNNNNNNNNCKIIPNPSMNTNNQTKKSNDKKNNYSPNGMNTYENNKNENKVIQRHLPNVINLLSKNASGFLKVNILLSNNIYGITLRPNDLIQEFQEIITKLPEKCNSMKLNYEYKPNIGDLACGQGGEISDWHRGYVLTLTPKIQFAAIDKTKVITVQKIVPYPNEFLNVCTFGMICEINANDDTILITNNYYEYKVINNENEINIEIKLNEIDTIRGILKVWEPKLKPSDIQCVQLKNESQVCITFYLNHYTMFVRSLKTEDSEEFNKLMQEVAKCGLSAAYLEKPPVVGDTVISQYIDNNFYRSIVARIQGEDAIVTYIDFGNSEQTQWKNLRVLPDDLKKHQSCVTKVLLKDVSTDIAMTKEVSNYLSDLVGKEVGLTCKFNGIPHIDGVHLIMPNGESINDNIKQLLVPNWKIEEDKTVYTVTDIDALPLGNIGDTVKVVILHVIEENSEYFMCNLDLELITHVHEILPQLMKEYCESTEYYIPRLHELCLALFQDNWYRALCLSVDESKDTVTLFYIDYGNCEEVLYENVRPMTSDFLKPCYLANMCNIVNLLPEENIELCSPKLLKRISELVKADEIYEAKIIDLDDSGNYKIELPDVRRQLIEENLIPPS
ncbi:PREDICTED: MATH and LRR domain-containing protein PFE0570w-like [Polistes dominula]|uniref:MATH and LRR domain-containing protein PFE0570w-like n=1 Tax=Polistes dominula TaxID=743375 RepID=A0ABM1I7Q3_POLDO|nr:PREDICTED: MATH and LRR domain-containing protein PFE0570w-like [Polistes dominula]